REELRLFGKLFFHRRGVAVSAAQDVKPEVFETLHNVRVRKNLRCRTCQFLSNVICRSFPHIQRKCESWKVRISKIGSRRHVGEKGAWTTRNPNNLQLIL